MKVAYNKESKTLTLRSEGFLEEAVLRDLLLDGQKLVLRITDWHGRDKGLELPIRVIYVTLSGNPED